MAHMGNHFALSNIPQESCSSLISETDFDLEACDTDLHQEWGLREVC